MLDALRSFKETGAKCRRKRQHDEPLKPFKPRGADGKPISQVCPDTVDPGTVYRGADLCEATPEWLDQPYTLGPVPDVVSGAHTRRPPKTERYMVCSSYVNDMLCRLRVPKDDISVDAFADRDLHVIDRH